MKMIRTVLLLAAAAIAAPSAVHAQSYPMEPGDYIEVGLIDVEDGGDYDYAVFLAGQWRKNQEFAKAQGWIKDYAVQANVNPRPGEPDLYLITRFSSLPDAAEQKRRGDMYNAFMKANDAELSAQSGARKKIRTVMGSVLLQDLKFK